MKILYILLLLSFVSCRVKYKSYNDATNEIVISGTKFMGKWDGDFVFYYSNGLVYAKGEYARNKKDGNWIYYDINGDTSMIGLYEKGLRQGVWTLYEFRSNNYQTVTFEDDNITGKVVNYENDRIESYGECKDGLLLQNTWKICSDKGTEFLRPFIEDSIYLEIWDPEMKDWQGGE
jgi:antitoxin component YwqK of YwqJK toxin-antitoxin module